MATEFKDKPSNWGTLGGTNKMIGFRGVGTQESGVSSQEGDGGRRDMGPATGSAKAFVSSGVHNTDYAGTQESGTSGPTKKGGNAKFAEGGTTKMFGNTGSRPATPA